MFSPFTSFLMTFLQFLRTLFHSSFASQAYNYGPSLPLRLLILKPNKFVPKTGLKLELVKMMIRTSFLGCPSKNQGFIPDLYEQKDRAKDRLTVSILERISSRSKFVGIGDGSVGSYVD